MGSKNKVQINGRDIQEKSPLNTQDLVALGTTSFLIIDQENTRETIISPFAGEKSPYLQTEERKENELEELAEQVAKKKLEANDHSYSSYYHSWSVCSLYHRRFRQRL